MATAATDIHDVDGSDPVEDEEGISYPLRVDYCGLCTMPPEVNHIKYKLLKQWVQTPCYACGGN